MPLRQARVRFYMHTGLSRPTLLIFVKGTLSAFSEPIGVLELHISFLDRVWSIGVGFLDRRASHNRKHRQDPGQNTDNYNFFQSKSVHQPCLLKSVFLAARSPKPHQLKPTIQFKAWQLASGNWQLAKATATTTAKATTTAGDVACVVHVVAFAVRRSPVASCQLPCRCRCFRRSPVASCQLPRRCRYPHH
jgi:hypothetical protein